MDIYLINRAKTVNAHARYNVQDKTVTVCKGSVISEHISGGTFRSANSVEKLRNANNIKGNIVIKDITFKSASTAANFVTGSSTNGLLAWKDKDGNTLKSLIE